MEVTLYTTGPDCTLCERVRPVLEGDAAALGFALRVVDLRFEDAPASDYVIRTPVIHIDAAVACEGVVDLADLRARLRARASRGR